MSEFRLDFRDYVDVRARVQRFTDAKCFNGWVTSIDGARAVVDVQSASGFDAGQAFLLQVSGLKSAITCEARLDGVEGKTLHLAVVGPVKIGPRYEDARIRQSLDGFAEIDGQVVPIGVGDVSSGGMGLYINMELPMWKTILVMVQTPAGCVRVEGQVRYCRELDDDRWRYRIGIFAPDMEEWLGHFMASRAHVATV